LVYSHFILEQLELREWTQQDFAEITGFTQTHISELLHDNTPLGFDTASILGKVFETSTDYWPNLDQGYRLWIWQQSI